MNESVLQLKGISKDFGSVRVLDGIDLSVRPGEVHALLGENGAGKSTMMKIVMGMHAMSEGEIFFDGKKYEVHSPREALEAGITMIHQELNPIVDMSIAENIFIGKEPVKYGGKGLRLVDKKTMAEQTRKLLQDVELNVSPWTKMCRLSIAQMQLVEIVKAISREAKVIIMDEPTATLTEKEVEVLFRHIEKLKARGVAIIYISHRLDEIFRICDRVTVLRDGRIVRELLVRDCTQDELISLMVGRQLDDIYPKSTAVFGEKALEVRGLSCLDKVHDVSFYVRKGEILGIAGLVGAGRSETMSALFGVLPRSGGEILVNGKPVRIRTPRDAVAHKIAYITEDRKVTGLNLIGSVRENTTIVSIRKLLKCGLLNRGKELRATRDYIDKLKIKTESEEKRTGQLSGGNQQKVVIAKWLLGDPDIIIMDEPTRGIDVGAKHDIYKLMDRLAQSGKAIIMISSEMPEVIGMSDRILVFAEGRIAGELERKDFDQNVINKLQFSAG